MCHTSGVLLNIPSPDPMSIQSWFYPKSFLWLIDLYYILNFYFSFWPNICVIYKFCFLYYILYQVAWFFQHKCVDKTMLSSLISLLLHQRTVHCICVSQLVSSLTSTPFVLNTASLCLQVGYYESSNFVSLIQYWVGFFHFYKILESVCRYWQTACWDFIRIALNL